jgi:hypothetical protein
MIPREVVLAAVQRCPDGMLGKLACTSKEFREACSEEILIRTGRATSLPPVSVSLFATAEEVDWAIDCGCPLHHKDFTVAIASGGSVEALEKGGI